MRTSSPNHRPKARSVDRSRLTGVRTILRLLATLALIVVAAAPAFGSGGSEPAADEIFRIGVFVPGVVEGSPTYEMLVEGATGAVEERENATIKVVEGGFNQGQWEQSLTSMAASSEYDLIISSNPQLPELARSVLESFPEQRFLLLDGYAEGVEQIHSVMFNQREQAFLAGYFAGLITTSRKEHANPDTVVGLLAGQEYPIMNEVILPAYELGARSVVADARVDFRVLGNWFDVSAAAELAESMMIGGSDIILTIAGGGNQGVIATARERGGYVIWYDVPGYAEEPGVVIGSTFVALDLATRERTLAAIDGELEFGTAEVLGVADGYVGFVTDDRRFTSNVPQELRDELDELIARMESGELYLQMPTQTAGEPAE